MTINEAIWRDLSPFTIGFENVFTQLDRVRSLPQTNYPPYNIRKGTTEDTFLIELAVAGLKAKYDNSNGYEGRMLTGKSTSSSDVFRSQAQLVQAMADPRYDNDPAYRADVVEKLNRSDLQF